jgi:hypothetical protein
MKEGGIMKSTRLSFRFLRRLSSSLILGAYLFCPDWALAQNPASTGASSGSLPDSPTPHIATNSQNAPARFVGYMTNPSFIFPDIAHGEGPLTTDQKFKLFMNQTISPPYIFVAAVSAAYDQARNSPKDYGQGWDAYGSRFGADMARASSNSFFSSFVFASVWHQDPRFFPQSHPSLWSSVKYSARRVFITRTDSGGDTFNTSGILGTAAAEALANAYLPASQQTAANNCQRVGTDLAWKFGANMFKNYWPTLFHHMGLNRLKVIPDPSLAGSAY